MKLTKKIYCDYFCLKPFMTIFLQVFWILWLTCFWLKRDDFSLLKPGAIDHIILWSLLYGLPVIGKFTETERLVIPKGWGTREWKWLLIARNVCLGQWKVRNWGEGVAAHYFECTKCCWIIHTFSNKLCLFHLN